MNRSVNVSLEFKNMVGHTKFKAYSVIEVPYECFPKYKLTKKKKNLSNNKEVFQNHIVFFRKQGFRRKIFGATKASEF